MAERIFALPDLGEGLEEGTITAWLVNEGDEVELNQPIAEIETAKAAVEIPSPFAGRILRLHVEAGSEAKVGAPLVTFEVAGEVAGEVVGDAAEAGGPLATDPARARAGDAAPTTGAASSSGSIAATPAVRKLAKDLGVDLTFVSGSGPGGRVTREDVEAFARSGVLTSAYPAGTIDGEPVTALTVSSNTPSREIPHSSTRRAIAARLTEVAAIPQVTTFRTVDCTALEAYRRALDVSPLSIFVAALAAICADHELLNASWTTDAILVHEKVNVGVAIDTERGLMVPVLADAGALGVDEIANEIARLARAVRAGGLRPGMPIATIAVSNTGSYGSEAGTPLLNPGHAVTVALGVIATGALVVDGRVEARPACTLSLTFDHRVLDGATVGRGVTDLVELLESSERLEALPR